MRNGISNPNIKKEHIEKLKNTDISPNVIYPSVIDNTTCMITCLKSSNCNIASYNKITKKCSLNTCPGSQLFDSDISDTFSRELNQEYSYYK